MTLMSRITGKDITDQEHLIQSITDILTTPLGSRVAVRDYGCTLWSLVDRPVNRQWIVQAYASIAAALARWEPRYALNQIRIDLTYLAQGIVQLTLNGLYKPTGRVMVLEDISLKFGQDYVPATVSS